MTVSERPGTSYQVEIHFVIFNHFLISSIFLYENCSVKKILSPLEIWNRSRLYLLRNLGIFDQKRDFCLTTSARNRAEKEAIAYLLFPFLISASLLLNNLFGLLTTEEYLNCKAVYLHVLTTNYVALRFYERHKFRLFRYMPCYYAIKGRQKNGYLYVLYINGGKPPWTFSYPLIYVVCQPRTQAL
jgi:hypothetical protein